MAKHRRDEGMSSQERGEFIRAMALEYFAIRTGKNVGSYSDLPREARWEYQDICERLLEAGERSVREKSWVASTPG